MSLVLSGSIHTFPPFSHTPIPPCSWSPPAPLSFGSEAWLISEAPAPVAEEIKATMCQVLPAPLISSNCHQSSFELTQIMAARKLPSHKSPLLACRPSVLQLDAQNSPLLPTSFAPF